MPNWIRRPFTFTAAVLLAALVAGSPTAQAQTLTAVKARGTLNCGVGQGLLGFSSQGDKNNWTGLDVDICRAIAAAIFGDPSKVTPPNGMRLVGLALVRPALRMPRPNQRGDETTRPCRAGGFRSSS